ncbi:MAG: hypothetical protein A3G81_29360 [Betaproteobacteria bacterium RIFCSPLOWO2_12_FULL_65_14]|nr:MAG: hypothetical protein A3G81_29360 [Betaproteobacteria bacterium RIFCSPLOWO2_12_FULL_65_14]
MSPHDLVELLNFELAAYEQLSGCHFSSIRPMADPDDAGCNWRDARLQSNHHLDPVERDIVRSVIEQTRQEFNVG